MKTLMANADLAMYRAKEEGRNTYRVFTPSMNRKIKQRMKMENNLRRAVENNELLLYYQPKINCRTGMASGVEALIRWRRPGTGLVLPDEFVPLAEDIGLIVAMGEWAVRQACFQAAEWRSQGLTDLGMAVNLSPRQFREKNLVEMVADSLAQSGLPAERLKLEVTENAVMYDVEGAIQTMVRLSRLGVGLSLDDFGRGLLLALLPEALSDQRTENRPELCARHTRRRRLQLHCGHDHLHQPEPGHPSGRRRGGDPGTTRISAPQSVRSTSGLPVQPADPAPGRPRSVQRRPPFFLTDPLTRICPGRAVFRWSATGESERNVID